MRLKIRDHRLNPITNCQEQGRRTQPLASDSKARSSTGVPVVI